MSIDDTPGIREQPFAPQTVNASGEEKNLPFSLFTQAGNIGKQNAPIL